MLELREIHGFSLYQAGSDGHIYRVIKSKRSPRFPRRRIGHLSGYGYIALTLFQNGAQRQTFAHILIAEAFIGPKPSPQHQVCHLNGDKTDNRPCNLMWGTPKDNESHKVLHNTAPRHENNGRAVLSYADVTEMRRLRKKGLSYTKLAKQFRVCPSNARAVCVGISWR